MAILEFYGVRVPYTGAPLGIYKPRDPDNIASQMCPEYAEADVFHLEAQARAMKREQFVEALRSLRGLAAEQSGGSVGRAGPILRPVGFDGARQALANTRDFVDEVLRALQGK